jgi:transcriptional regulator with XRE-family HTH domain
VANDLITRLLARIRALREARELSQEALAERAGIKYKHYQAIEAGRKPKLQLPTLFKIAKGLEMEPWELLNFDTPPMVANEDAATDHTGAAPKKPTARSTKRLGRDQASAT